MDSAIDIGNTISNLRGFIDFFLICRLKPAVVDSAIDIGNTISNLLGFIKRNTKSNLLGFIEPF